MKIKITSNLKSFEKKLNKIVQNKIADKEYEIKREKSANMPFEPLDKESENYLKELLTHKEFYDVRFQITENEGCKNSSVLQNLIDKGFLDSRGISYNSDNTGYQCVVKFTQKAKTYDEMKDIYNQKTEVEMYRDLDEESEAKLNELIEMDKGQFFPIFKNFITLDIAKDLEKKGYIEVGPQGFTGFNVGGPAMIMVTRDGKNYWKKKERNHKSSQQTIYTETYNDLRGADLSNSNNQIGNSETKQKIDKRNQTNIAQEKQKFNFWTMIVIPIFVAVVAGIIVWLITKS